MRIVLATLAVLALLGILVGSSCIDTRNDWVSQEQGIKAQYSQNQNNYDNFVKTVRETAQIPEMYADDLRKAYAETMTGRYGPNGSTAVMQFIQEKNPELSLALYSKIQQMIEAGRASFQADQKMLIDKKRAYETSLDVFPGNTWAGVLGFPRLDLAKYDIVTSEETDKAFSTKKADPIKLR